MPFLRHGIYPCVQTATCHLCLMFEQRRRCAGRAPFGPLVCDSSRWHVAVETVSSVAVNRADSPCWAAGLGKQMCNYMGHTTRKRVRSVRLWQDKPVYFQNNDLTLRQPHCRLIYLCQGPRPLAQCRFRAVQCWRCRHNALRVLKCSRVVPVYYIIVWSPLLEEAIVLYWSIIAVDLFPLHTDPHASTHIPARLFLCLVWTMQETAFEES
jgi:hypothetical protein